METQNRPWNLESFVDALVVELDKTRETLAVKAINKPLTYTVKDMSLDLQIFPTYDGDQVRFITARPGEQGASTMNVKLDSITDQVVRATTKKLPSRDDTALDRIDVDDDTKRELRKIGITSVKDLEEVEKKNVDIGKVTAGKKIDYTRLANIIQKARRTGVPPVVSAVSLSREEGKPVLLVRGRNLSLQGDFLPVAVINKQVAGMLSFDRNHLKIDVSGRNLSPGENELIVALDPYTVFRATLNGNGMQEVDHGV